MYLSKTVFNHRPFASIHWELLREESDCKAVSQDKVKEAAEYCIALHLPQKKAKTESLKQATVGFFHRSISSTPLIKSPDGEWYNTSHQTLVRASYSGFPSTVVYSGNGVIQDLLRHGFWSLKYVTITRH